MKCRMAEDVRNVQRRARVYEIAEDIAVSGDGINGLDPLCTEDGERNESELEGRLGGIQIWGGARFDMLDKEDGVRHVATLLLRRNSTDLLDYIVIPAHTCQCEQ